MSDLKNEVKIYVKFCGENGEPLDDYIAATRKKLAKQCEFPGCTHGHSPDRLIIGAINAVKSIRGFIRLLENNRSGEVGFILDSGNFQGLRDAVGVLDSFVYSQPSPKR